jgi:hypothetical protein
LDLPTVLDAHLFARPAVNGVQYKSSLIALLQDARGTAERDTNTGQVLPGKLSTSWLGAVGYLALVDQVGSCFMTPGQQVTDKVAVVHAIRTFSHVKDEPTVQALYALRCALAHDYALYNDGRAGNGQVRPLLRHAFNFCADTTSQLVRLPTKTWSGTYNAQVPPPDDEITTVNLRKVGDLAEEIVAELRTLYAASDLAIRLPINEFHVRYGMFYRIT